MILPVEAALERVPRSLHRSLGRSRRPARRDLPQGHPAAGHSRRRRRLDLHLLADARRLHHSQSGGLVAALHRPGGLSLQGTAGNIPLAAAFAMVPMLVMAIYLDARQTLRSLRCPLTPQQGRSRGPAGASGSPQRLGGLLFLNLPLAFILLYAFTTDDRSFTFPPPGLTLQMVRRRLGARRYLAGAVALGARGPDGRRSLALVLGTLAAAAMYRFNFFGKELITLLILLPIALPGHRHRHLLRSAFGSPTFPSAIGPSCWATPPSASSWSTTT